MKNTAKLSTISDMVEAILAAEMELLTVPDMLKLASGQLQLILEDWDFEELKEVYDLLESNPVMHARVH